MTIDIQKAMRTFAQEVQDLLDSVLPRNIHAERGAVSRLLGRTNLDHAGVPRPCRRPLRFALPGRRCQDAPMPGRGGCRRLRTGGVRAGPGSAWSRGILHEGGATTPSASISRYTAVEGSRWLGVSWVKWCDKRRARCTALRMPSPSMSAAKRGWSIRLLGLP